MFTKHRIRQAPRRYPARHHPTHYRPGKISPVVFIVGIGIVLAAVLIGSCLFSPPKDTTATPQQVATTGADGTVIKTSAGAPKIPSKKRVVRVGLNSWIPLAQEKGWLKEAFDPLNVEVEVVDRRVAGSAEAALFLRGDLNIAERMAYPSLQHKANGFDFVVVWASGDAHPRRATTVVRTASTVKTLADLKGKVLGAHRLGCPYFATYEALLAQGIQLDTEQRKGDVRFVNVTGNPAILALLAGEIEALATHVGIPEFALLLEEGKIREIGTALPGGQYTTGGGRALILTTRRFANQNPDIVQAYLRLYDKARRYIVDEDHYDEAAELSSKVYRTPKSVSLYVTKNEASLYLDKGRPDAQETIDALNRFLKWSIENGDDFYGTKPLTPKQVDEFLDRRFFAGGEYFVDTSGNPPAEVEK